LAQKGFAGKKKFVTELGVRYLVRYPATIILWDSTDESGIAGFTKFDAKELACMKNIISGIDEDN
jgi:hypothetical protein